MLFGHSFQVLDDDDREETNPNLPLPPLFESSTTEMRTYDVRAKTVSDRKYKGKKIADVMRRMGFRDIYANETQGLVIGSIAASSEDSLKKAFEHSISLEGELVEYIENVRYELRDE